MNPTNNRIVNQFIKQFALQKKKGHEKIFVGVDIHETCMKPTWSTELSSEFYDCALDALRLMSMHKDVCLILWSCSLPELNKVYHKMFLNHGVIFNYINENPECRSTEYADFETKLYFSVGLDDKFGFVPEEDWPAIKEYFGYLKDFDKFSFNRFVSTNPIHTSYIIPGEPEMLHIVKSGYEDTYFVFHEDGYELEPWRSGLTSMSSQQILDEYKIDVKKEYNLKK
jgi:hypothetical protein